MTGTTIIQDATLLIENDKILQIGTDVDLSDAEVVDCKGSTITPGLIDPHSHAGIWGGDDTNDDDGNEVSEAITPYIRTLDSLYPEDVEFQDAIRGGVTTLGVTHGSANPIGGQVVVIKPIGLIADDMVIRAPAGIKMALGENPKRVGDRMKRAPTSRMGVAYLIRKTFYEVIEYAKEWEHFRTLFEIENAKPETDRKPLKEPKFDLGKEALVKVLNREIPIRCHAHRMDDIRTAIRLSEEFGYDLILDHSTEAYRIADEIISRGIPLNVGPVFGPRAKRELNRQTPATAGILIKKGATVSIMTDAPFNPQNNLRDLVIFAIREGLPQDRALETITINPAKVLGVEERVGSLEPSKDADLVFFDGDPWDARTHVVETWINGKRVYKRDGPYIPNPDNLDLES
ncbi:MAG: amidohydrolase [Candidatus Heimdallarchaeota archaeon]|nr:amidohydrolase [Candidatus Heimdallarchaeota archaeon]